MTEATMQAVMYQHTRALRAEDGLMILTLDRAAAEWLAQEQVRLELLDTRLAYYDSLIAAVAVVNNLILVTRNTKDLRNIRGFAC